MRFVDGLPPPWRKVTGLHTATTATTTAITATATAKIGTGTITVAGTGTGTGTGTGLAILVLGLHPAGLVYLRLPPVFILLPQPSLMDDRRV